MADRFDLEKAILDCWSITEDIKLMKEQDAYASDMVNLACVYNFKFQKLWNVFEDMVHEGKFKKEE
jgi:hypothetical protein